MEFKISIDKLSFTARPLDTSRLSMYLSSWRNESGHFAKHWRTPNHYLYTDNFQFPCGTLLQFGKVHNDDKVRLEFNPNKTSFKLIHQLCSMLKTPNITRIDYAIDIFDFDFSDIIVEQKVKRKTVEYKSRSGKRETLYIGNPKTSDNFIRIYNKGIEQARQLGDDDEKEDYEPDRTWWRFEAVRKDFDKRQDLLWNPFQITLSEKRTTFKKEHQLKTLKTSEKAMIFYLQHHPEAWEELSYNSRKKYQDYAFDFHHDILHETLQPSFIFEQKKKAITEDLISWLQPAYKNTTSITATSTVKPDSKNRGKFENVENTIDWIEQYIASIKENDTGSKE